MSVVALDFLAAAIGETLGRPVQREVPLARYTTYRLGGPAALFVEPTSLEELRAVREALAEHPVDVLVVGRGSNLLVADAGFPGLALHLAGAFADLEIDEQVVAAGGGVALPVLARRTAAAGRAGLEFYVGIPGSVGGAVRMNAGGHGRDTADVLERAWLLDLAVGGDADHETEVPAAVLELGYRRSALTATQVVTRAEFAVVDADPSECEERIDEVVRWRREHQPGGSNAGSVFTNPPGDSAGRVIDACGLKGYRVGGAAVSEKHANFFQADADATADDVHQLVADVRRIVAERTGVRLVPELTMVGFAKDDGVVQ